MLFRSGIIHCDIKPANILLEYSGEVKLSDFGIAHIYGGNRLTNINSVVGTLEYMSPEQSQAGPIGPKTDLYSLGAVLYALLVGSPPYQAKTLAEVLQKHQSGPPPKISEKRSDVPEVLEAIIMELLSIKPEARPTNAYILTRRLQVILKAYLGNPGLVKVRPSEKKAVPPVHLPPPIAMPNQKPPEEERLVDSREIDGKNPIPLADPSRFERTSTQFRVTPLSETEKERLASSQENDSQSDGAQNESSQSESSEGHSEFHFDSRSDFHCDSELVFDSNNNPVPKRQLPAVLGKKSPGLSSPYPSQDGENTTQKADDSAVRAADARKKTSPSHLRSEKQDSSRKSRRVKQKLSGRHLNDWRDLSAIARKLDTSNKNGKSPIDVTKSQVLPGESSNISSHGKQASSRIMESIARKNAANSASDSFVSSAASSRPYIDLAAARSSSDQPVTPLDILREPDTKSGTRSRFIPVSEEELGDFSKYKDETPRKVISIQTIFLSVCLLGIGFFIYYLLQPIPADTLYDRITKAVEAKEGEGGPINVSQILQAEDNIELFLTLFPGDPRSDQMYRYMEEIKLDKLQREFDNRINRMQDVSSLEPLERTCLEAFALARTQPEKAAAKFQAILDLYETGAESLGDLLPETDEQVNHATTETELTPNGNEAEENAVEDGQDEPKTQVVRIRPDYIREGRPRSESRNDLCLELVRRRLHAIQSQSAISVEEQKKFLQNRLDKAAEIDWIYPDQAELIRRGIIEIYGDKSWAIPFVEQAQEGLEN